jgi:predicted CoA-substrate-specific enzyme activase
MSLQVGVDVGSNTAKAAVIKEGHLLGTHLIATGYNVEAAGRRVIEELLDLLNVPMTAVERIIATGYGRKSVLLAHKTVTELMCHAAGARFLEPSVRSLIDIGGQDSKAIVMDENGRMTNFTMNDKCAAGTGRFLEVMARAMEADLNEFGKLSLMSEKPSKISSTCTVFAESEVISLVSKGELRENIIAGIHEAIASRIASMAKRIGISPPVMMTGGVSHNIGVVKAMEKAIGYPLLISPHAQLAGAIGAALL